MLLERSRIAWIAIAGILAATVAMGLVISQGSPAFEQGTQQAAPPAILPVGELRLELGAQDQFAFYPYDASNDSFAQNPLHTQTITERRCEIQASTNPLVDLSEAGPAGLSGDAMGVFGGNARGGRGVPCSRIESNGQTLVWKLAGPLADYTAVSADFDVEMKSNAIAVATFYLNGDLTGTRTLFSGSSAPDDQTPCSLASDSGSDSGINDNCRWEIDGVLFDEVRFTADAGEYSLEGGADYPVPGPGEFFGSSITLIDAGVLDCNQTGDSFDFADTDAGRTVSGTRLENYDGSTCVAILYRLDADDPAEGGVTFVKDPDAQPFAQYVFDIDWEPEPATLDRLTKIQFDTDPTRQEIDVEICTGEPVDANGASVNGNSTTFAGLSGLDTEVDEAADLVPGNTYFEYACVLHEEITYLGPNEDGLEESVVSQRIYVAGDLRFSRF